MPRPATASGTPHHRRERGGSCGGSQVAGPGADTISDCVLAIEMSTSGLTLRAALVAAASVLLLVVAGHWRPVRRHWWRSRRRRPPVVATQVVRLPIVDYRPARWWERFAAVTGLGVVSAVVGAIVATVVAAFLIYVVTTLTSLLQ